MGIAIIIAVILILGIGIFLWYRLKKKPSLPPIGPTGPTATCGNLGQACVKGKCCASTTQCQNGLCVSQVQPSIEAFFLSSEPGSCIGILPDGYLGVTSNSCQWTDGTVPSQFWYWDGISNLVLKTPILGANGEVIQVVDEMIESPTVSGKYITPTKTPKIGVLLTLDNAIYSSDYNFCIGVDKTNHLVWNDCLGTPSTFNIIQPSGCSGGGGQCSNSNECCPPYGSCISGQCSKCFGDPMKYQDKMCPGDDNYVLCQESGIYECKSRCDGDSASCLPNQTVKCEVNGDKWSLTCNYKCTGPQKECPGGTNVSSCTGSDTTSWNWVCPIDPCEVPAPVYDHNKDTAPGAGYTWKDNHYENSSSSPWLYPIWQCKTQTWTFQQGCNQVYKMNCTGKDQAAVCAEQTNFQWQCLPRASTDLCGLTASTGACGPDAECFDISNCGSGNGTATDWKWICPSSATDCEIIKIYDWANPPTQMNVIGGNTQTSIVFKDQTTPIFPAIRNDYCRSGSATDTSHPDVNKIINNPSGNVMGNGANIPFSFLPNQADTSGDSAYIYTKYEAGVQPWECVSPNPCLPGGTFVNQNGTVYSPLVINGNGGEQTPPTTAELFTVGKCACDPGHAGLYCQYTGSVCNNNGTPQSCNTPGVGNCTSYGYYCGCKPGFYGPQCELTDADCSNNGTPAATLPLSCTCNTGYYGKTCQCPSTIISPKIKISENTKWIWYELMMVGEGVFTQVSQKLAIKNIGGNTFSLTDVAQNIPLVADLQHLQMTAGNPDNPPPLDWSLSECGFVITTDPSGKEYTVKAGDASSPDNPPPSGTPTLWLVESDKIKNTSYLVYLSRVNSFTCSGNGTIKPDDSCVCADTWNGKHCNVRWGSPGTTRDNGIRSGIAVLNQNKVEGNPLIVNPGYNVWAMTPDGTVSLAEEGRNWYVNKSSTSVNLVGTPLIDSLGYPLVISSTPQQWVYDNNGNLVLPQDYHPSNEDFGSSGVLQLELNDTNIAYAPPPRTVQQYPPFDSWVPPQSGVTAATSAYWAAWDG